MRPISKCTDAYAAANLRPGSNFVLTLFFSTDDNAIKGVTSTGYIINTSTDLINPSVLALVPIDTTLVGDTIEGPASGRNALVFDENDWEYKVVENEGTEKAPVFVVYPFKDYIGVNIFEPSGLEIYTKTDQNLADEAQIALEQDGLSFGGGLVRNGNSIECAVAGIYRFSFSAGVSSPDTAIKVAVNGAVSQERIFSVGSGAGVKKMVSGECLIQLAVGQRVWLVADVLETGAPLSIADISGGNGLRAKLIGTRVA